MWGGGALAALASLFSRCPVRPGRNATRPALLFWPQCNAPPPTLLPPPWPSQDHTYLCNMAVAPQHRGRGHGLRLLRAAERLAAAVGEREVYLHLRCVWGWGRGGAAGAVGGLGP